MKDDQQRSVPASATGEPHGRDGSRVWLHWTAAAALAIAVVTSMTGALYVGFARWQPGVRVAEGPSLAVERATRTPPAAPAADDRRVIAR